MFFDPKNFDPSKLDPKVVQELSDLMKQLPPEQIQKMQSMMHNAMAGFDIKNEVTAFESSLPLEFRQKLFNLMGRGGMTVPVQEVSQPVSADMSIREARLTLLRGVAAGSLAPEAALKALFPEEA